MPRSHARGVSAVFLIFTLFLVGCTNDHRSHAIAVSVAPSTVSVQTGLTQQFTATVSNTSDAAVDWKVNGDAKISGGGMIMCAANCINMN